jgi:hypothetical protein
MIKNYPNLAQLAKAEAPMEPSTDDTPMGDSDSSMDDGSMGGGNR